MNRPIDIVELRKNIIFILGCASLGMAIAWGIISLIFYIKYLLGS